MTVSQQIDTILLLNVSYEPALSEQCVSGTLWVPTVA
jgi:hypothetical protein